MDSNATRHSPVGRCGPRTRRGPSGQVSLGRVHGAVSLGVVACVVRQMTRAGGGRSRAGPRPARQRRARAGAPTSDAAERQRAELGGVAGGVVGGERAAAQRLGHALVDERAQQDVLDAVGDAAERSRPARATGRRRAAPATRRPARRWRPARRRSATRARRGARGRRRRRPCRASTREQHAVAGLPGAEHVGDEERLGGRGDREERRAPRPRRRA